MFPHRTIELSKYPVRIDKRDIQNQLGSIFLTSTHLIDVQDNHEDYSVPLQQIKEIRLYKHMSLGKWIIKMFVALIFVFGPLYVLLHITDFWKKIFNPNYLGIWIIIFTALALLVCGISFFLDFINNKKYIKVVLRAARTRRMLYFNRKEISEQEVNSLLQEIKAAMDSAPVSHHEQGN